MKTTNFFPFETKWNESEFVSILENVAEMFNGHNKILDVGCGRGEATHYLSKKGFNPIGLELIDFREDWKKLWKLMPNTKFQTYNGLYFPYKDQTFDGVLLNNIFEHIEKKESFISEVKRILKSNGVAIFILPTLEWKISKLHKIPRKILLGLRERNIKLMFGAWFVHAPNVYGKNYLKEVIDYANWKKIINNYFKIQETTTHLNGNQILLKVKK